RRHDAGAQADRRHRRLLRRRQLLDVRPGVLAAVPVDVAGGADLGQGLPACGGGPVDHPARPGRGQRPVGVGARRGGVRRPRAGAVRDPGQPVLLHGTAVGRRDHRPRRHPPRARHGAGRVRGRPAPRAGLRPVPDVRGMSSSVRPFGTVLVAARGEIACRIIRTLRRLGVRSVAVWSDADRDARHVREADVAVRLGPAPPAESYLRIEAVLAAARATGAEAVHPGYGFLAENADFARALADAGIVFVGPGVEALHVMGDKIRARAHVEAAGVGVVPGIARPGLSDEELLAAAEGIGFPVLVKPSAGGGGKGMHVAWTAQELSGALPAARRVATAAFGDETLFLERYLRRPRHIEVQVLADAHGGVVHLGERECSLQRRHQKIVEEAPSPLLDGPTRQRMGEAACTIARSIGYLGAGTVEMLVEDGAPETFYFMEMNTRLQV